MKYFWFQSIQGSGIPPPPPLPRHMRSVPHTCTDISKVKVPYLSPPPPRSCWKLDSNPSLVPAFCTAAPCPLHSFFLPFLCQITLSEHFTCVPSLYLKHFHFSALKTLSFIWPAGDGKVWLRSPDPGAAAALCVCECVCGGLMAPLVVTGVMSRNAAHGTI